MQRLQSQNKLDNLITRQRIRCIWKKKAADKNNDKHDKFKNNRGEAIEVNLAKLIKLLDLII